MGLSGINTHYDVCGDFCFPVVCVSMLHRIIDIFVSAALEQRPYFTRYGECLFHFARGMLHLVEKEGQNAVATDILCDVFLGIVSTHLSAVINVLFKDVAQYIRIDVFASSLNARIKMPAPLVEEIKQAFECFIGNVNILVVLLQLMLVEHTTIKIRDSAKDKRCHRWWIIPTVRHVCSSVMA